MTLLAEGPQCLITCMDFSFDLGDILNMFLLCFHELSKVGRGIGMLHFMVILALMNEPSS